MTEFFAVFASIVVCFLAFLGLCSLTIVWYWVLRFKIRGFVRDYIWCELLSKRKKKVFDEPLSQETDPKMVDTILEGKDINIDSVG